MSLESNYKDFQSVKITKADFIKKNYSETFSSLFDLSSYLPNTDIKKIEIEDSKLIMTYRRNGMKLMCEKDEHRTAPIETINFLKYEEDEVSVFNELLKGKKLFFDIGGNIGFYAVNSATNYTNLKVQTFEPVPKMFQTLSQNIELNGLQPRVKTNNFGFSDAPGTVSFFIYPFGGTNASMVNVSDAKDAIQVTSKVLKLDDYVKETSLVPDIIKCDVEGAEKLVLMGGLETIKRHKPVMLFELLRKWSAKFNYHPNEVLTVLHEIGYKCFVPHNGKLKLFSKVDDSTLETNFFFLHSDVHQNEIKELVV